VNLELQILHDLRRHEGCRLSVYKDTVGVWTIGYGRTKGITANTKPITQEQADAWLLEDLKNAWNDCRKVYPGLDQLDKVRRSVLINMCFNLGYAKLSKFVGTLGHIEAGRYKDAALNMLDSLWAKQVGQRATELAKRMATGKIEPRHLLGE
jgi:lysozyme